MPAHYDQFSNTLIKGHSALPSIVQIVHRVLALPVELVNTGSGSGVFWHGALNV